MELNTTAQQDGASSDSSELISDERKTTLIEMGKAGLFYGRRKSKTHPKMKPFIYGQRNGIEIIDGNRALTLLEEASNFISTIINEKGVGVLVVGTHPAVKAGVEKFASANKLPYVNGRWVGGTLTNFKIIHGRVEHFKKLKADRDAGRLDKYTKKELI